MHVHEKVLLCVAEDWFALSHFQPLVLELVALAREVVVATESSGRTAELEALGCRVVPFHFKRQSLNPLTAAEAVHRLAALVRLEKPSVLHAVGLKPIVISCLSQSLARTQYLCMHLTGMGWLAVSPQVRAAVIRATALGVVRRSMASPSTWLLAENDDDRDRVIGGQSPANMASRVAVLGGAGVDPDKHQVLPVPAAFPRAAFVGRLVRSKGTETLMQAAELLDRRGVRLGIDLYGRVDPKNPETVDPAGLEAWSLSKAAQSEGQRDWVFHGPTSDIGGVWARAGICVIPSWGGEGMPRVMLEAAAFGRALVVTDVPGCRHFVRNGVEGLIVPPRDAAALADALAALVKDPERSRAMGLAARERVLSGYTEAHVRQAVRELYLRNAPQRDKSQL